MGRVWGVGEASNHHTVGTGVRPEVHGLQSVMELALLICERMWVSCKGAFFLETGLYCGQHGGQGWAEMSNRNQCSPWGGKGGVCGNASSLSPQ